MLQQRDFSFIYKYFLAEKQATLVFLIVGIVAVILAVVCWFFVKTNPNFFKGAAIPLLAIGLLQFIVGFSVYSRTDKQKADIAYNIGMDPKNYVKQTEQPRMKAVMKNFAIYRWVEIALFIIGLSLIFLFRSNPDKSFWYGFGVALAIQAAIIFSGDSLAEKRGKIHAVELEKIIAD